MDAATYLRQTAEQLGFTSTGPCARPRLILDWQVPLGDTRPARGEGALVLLLLVHEPFHPSRIPLDERTGHWCTLSITHVRTGRCLPLRHPLGEGDWEAPTGALELLEQLRRALLALPLEWGNVKCEADLGEHRSVVMDLLTKLPPSAAKLERADRLIDPLVKSSSGSYFWGLLGGVTA